MQNLEKLFTELEELSLIASKVKSDFLDVRFATISQNESFFKFINGASVNLDECLERVQREFKDNLKSYLKGKKFIKDGVVYKFSEYAFSIESTNRPVNITLKITPVALFRDILDGSLVEAVEDEK